MKRHTGSRSSGTLVLWIGVAVAVSTGCGQDPDAADAEAPAAEPRPVQLQRDGAQRFVGVPETRNAIPYDVAASDVDGDGDTDLFVNWHHFGPLELFENRGGRFHLFDERGPTPSGLRASREAAEVYAPHADTLARVRARAENGLYLWHDVRRRGPWYLLWKDAARRYGGLRVELETSLGFQNVGGLAEGEFAQPRPERLEIDFAEAAVEREIRVQTERVGEGLVVRLGKAPSGETPSLFLGAGLEPAPGPEIEVWKPDPHGIAWVDVEGDARPELYLTRGALGGRLRPPMRAKTDRYYRPTPEPGAGGPLYALAPADVVAPDHARGRRVEWVDVQNDGRLALSIGAKDTPNRLLVRDPGSGVLRDRAPQLGLDLPGAELHTWHDVDGDGFQDLLYLAPGAVDVARNRGGQGFERVDGRSLGLALPEGGSDAKLPDAASLRLADFDADGDLDLWVLGFASQRTSHLFLAEADGFRDVSDAVGLAGRTGHQVVVLLDLDNDGFEDAVSFGPEAWIWHNQAGSRFAFERLPEALVPEPIHAALALDADADGRTDVVAIGRSRHLLRNVSAAGSFVDVVLEGDSGAPLGALACARYDDGRSPCRRLGSAHNTAFSQMIQPLRFGVAPGVRLEAIEVRWSGDVAARSYPPGAPGQTLRLHRGFEHARNLLLISVDTLRADRLGCYGYSSPTPNIDALAEEGFVFESMFTTSSTTLPAHVSLMTGLHPKDVRNGHFLSDSVTTLAEILGKRGYATVAVVSSLPLHARFNLDQGFEHYDSDFSSCRGSLELKGDRWYAHAYDVFDCNAEETNRRLFARLAAEPLEAPFFLWVHYFDPHLPYAPPADTYDATRVTRRAFPYRHRPSEADQRSLDELYDGEVRFVDRHVGRLLAELERRGLTRDTVVALVSDHGENLYQHDGYLDHSQVVYDTVMHVPFLLKLPGRTGGRVEALASTVDVAPTLLELLGVEPAGFEGLSLAAALEAPGAPGPRAYVSCETNDFGVADEDQTVAIRTRDAKYIYNAWKRRDHRFLVVDEEGRETLLRRPSVERVRDLRRYYTDWLANRKLGALSEPSQLDAATKEALRSLGYLR